MSYTRWSTVINSALTTEDQIELFKSGRDYLYVREKMLEADGAYISDWYIFWYSADESEGNNDLNEQLLAIWLKGEDKNPVLDYQTVKSMYQDEKWEILGFRNLRQIKLLKSSIGNWLDDIENEFK